MKDAHAHEGCKPTKDARAHEGCAHHVTKKLRLGGAKPLVQGHKPRTDKSTSQTQLCGPHFKTGSLDGRVPVTKDEQT